jgi:hypothetical protein
MGVTTNSKPRYPDATDPADVPLDVQELATDLDEIAYAQFTAPVTAPVVAETSAPVVVASPAIVYQAVPIVIEFPSPHILSAATGITFISLWDASTNLDTFAEVASGNGVPVCAVRRLTPTAASHTYRIRGLHDHGPQKSTRILAAAAPILRGSSSSGGHRSNRVNHRLLKVVRVVVEVQSVVGIQARDEERYPP